MQFFNKEATNIGCSGIPPETDLNDTARDSCQEEANDYFQLLERYLEKFEDDIARVLETPSEQGQIDGFLRKPKASDNPDYRNAYERAFTVRLLMSPEESQLFDSIQPFLEALLYGS